MANLSESLATDQLRILIYGGTGSGKTALTGLTSMYAELRPVYVYDWDLRIASLSKTLPKEFWPFLLTDGYRDGNIGGEAFIRMQAHIEKLPSLGVKTVAVDTGTFMMKGIMNRVLNLDGKPPSSVPQLQHYNQEISLFEETIARLCSKKLNLIVNCHEATLHDEVTSRVYKAIDLTGKKAPNRIPGYFNEFWHTEISQLSGREAKFMVRTRSDQTYAARTCFRSLDTLEAQESIWPKILKERKEMMNSNK